MVRPELGVGAEAEAAAGAGNQLASFVKADCSALLLLTSNMTDATLQKVMRFRSAREVWLELHRLFDGISEDKSYNLCMSFFGFKRNPEDDIATHMSKLKNIWSELSQNLKKDNKELPELLLICKILDTLGEEYTSFKSSWLLVPKAERTVESLTNHLCAFERNLASNSVPDQEVLITSSNARKQNVKNKDRKLKCNYCTKVGHRVKNCQKWIQDGKPPKNNSNPQTGTRNPTTSQTSVVNMTVMFVQNKVCTIEQDNWYVDNGATSHITNRGDLFTTYRHFDETHTVTTANGNILQAKGKGSIVVEANVEGKVLPVTLEDVWHVPGIQKNLFSVLAAHDKNADSKFMSTPEKCSISVNGAVKIVGSRQKYGGLYKLEVKNVIPKKMVANLATETQLYHERFAHQNKRHIRAFVKRELGIELPIDETLCEGCLFGKSHRQKFGTRTRASRPGELMHSDVCGPFPNSITNLRYFVLFRDDYSGYRLIYFMKAKSEVKQKLKEMIAEVHNTGHTIQTLLSDNGGEYDNKDVREILAKHGIKQRLTMPYTPEQNGCCERDNRTLVEAARTIMYSGEGFPQALWAEMLNAVTYVINRTGPSRVENKSPFELWQGKKPNVAHLKIIGSTCYAHIPKQKRKKLSKKAYKGRLVGYDNDDGYRIWAAVENNKYGLIRSRDVVFDEKSLYRADTETAPISQDTKSNELEIRLVSPISRPVFDFGQVVPPNEYIQHEEDDTISVEFGEEGAAEVPIDAVEDPITNESPEDSILSDEAPAEVSDSVIEEPSDNIEQEVEDEFFDTVQEKYDFRSRATLRPPRKFDDYVCNVDSFTEPQSYREAIESPLKEKWDEAMKRELNSLKENGTWTLQTLPKGRSAIPCKWVFKVKRQPDGTIERFKARLVAKGFKQRKGIDYEETYSPVARFATIRSLISVAASEGMYLTQFDVTTAFLYGNLNEELYMQQPEGYTDGSNKVCRLHKSLYGLKQAPRCWNYRFHEVLLTLDFKQSTSDPCLYTKKVGNRKILLTLYVDDGLVAATDKELADEFLISLKRKLKITTKPASFYLGMEIETHKDGTIKINQKAYIAKILERFGMASCNPLSTPIDVSGKVTENELQAENKEEKPFPYRETVGALAYLMVCTRPDIAFAVGVASRKLENPCKADWLKVKRILRYLKGTSTLGVEYRRDVSRGILEGFSDADHGGDVSTGRSTSGVVCRYAGGAISWMSQRQTSVAISTTEAELVAASEGAREIVWLKRILGDLTTLVETPYLSVDNEAAVRLAYNPEFHKRTKHIRIRHFFVREQVTDGNIVVKRVNTADQVADILTKGLAKPSFVRLREALGVS